MKIDIAVPGPVPTSASRKGNWVTAERWAGMLRGLGHEVHLAGQKPKGDLLIALHAKKTFDVIEAFHERHPERPLIVTLTGTDLYRDVKQSDDAKRAMAWATRLVVLQPQALEELAPELAAKARVIRQSTQPPNDPPPKPNNAFDVCVVGHLRDVKDPFRTAEAARLLPPESKIRVLHAGAALSDEMENRARQEMRENPRYRWLGELPRDETLRLMASSHLLAHTSRLEGGANAMSEAFVAGLPVVSSRVGGSVGMLDDDHPAYFEEGDTEALAKLLRRAETDPVFLAELERRSVARAALYRPEQEVAAWVSVLGEVL